MDEIFPLGREKEKPSQIKPSGIHHLSSMMAWKLSLVALVLLAAQGNVVAFAPSTLSTVRVGSSGSVTLSAVDEGEARSAYDDWRKKFNKGAFDEARFEAFKSNYETITDANVKATEKAKEMGKPKPQLFSLNEYGDYTAEEYKAAMASPPAPASAPAPATNVLGDAFEAAKQQSSASTALAEAADALAEEEMVRIQAPSNLLSVLSCSVGLSCVLPRLVLVALKPRGRNWQSNWAWKVWKSWRLRWTAWKGLLTMVENWKRRIWQARPVFVRST